MAQSIFSKMNNITTKFTSSFQIYLRRNYIRLSCFPLKKHSKEFGRYRNLDVLLFNNLSYPRRYNTTSIVDNSKIQKGRENSQQSIETLMPESEYNNIADTTLEQILELVTELENAMKDDEIDISLSQGVLNIQLGSNGCWVLNKQTPNRQIWWSSPISGPRRYENVTSSNISLEGNGHVWRNTRDGSELFSDLRDELLLATGFDIMQCHKDHE